MKLTSTDVSPVMQGTIRSIGATILVATWMLLRNWPVFSKDSMLESMGFDGTVAEPLENDARGAPARLA